MKRLPIGVMVPTLVIGVMALFMALPEFFVSLKKPVDFNELVEADIKAGLHVQGEVYAILDTFATEETWTENSNGSRTPAKTSGYFYIIPIGDESYIGLEGNGDNRATLKAIDSATWDYLTGVTENIEGETYWFEGHIEKMDDELYGYFTEWFEEMEYFGTGAEGDAMIAQCALPLMLEPMSPGLMPLIIIGFAMIALNILFVVLHMSYKKKAAAAKAASAAEPWSAPAASGDYSAPAAPQQTSTAGDPWDAPNKQ